MTYSIYYIILISIFAFYAVYCIVKGIEIPEFPVFINWTNTLIAFGVVGICKRLDKLTEKK